MKILLATDGSENSEEAAKFLVRFNFSSHDEIHIIHALSWVPALSEWGALYDNFKEIKEEIVPRILDSAAENVGSVKAKISTSFKEDYPDKAIVEASVESGADLIVMGARGLRGITSFLIGSVTKLVAINSPKPVLIVKPPRNTSGRLKVLYATDGSAHAKALGNTLSSLPFPDGSELIVLHVLTTAFEDIPERFAIEINERIKNIVADTRQKELKTSQEILEQAVQDAGGAFAKTEKITKFGDPATEILNVADTTEADIIAVGTSGMRGIKGMIGSVSRYIVNHSRCSLLIAR